MLLFESGQNQERSDFLCYEIQQGTRKKCGSSVSEHSRYKLGDDHTIYIVMKRGRMPEPFSLFVAKKRFPTGARTGYHQYILSLHVRSSFVGYCASRFATSRDSNRISFDYFNSARLPTLICFKFLLTWNFLQILLPGRKNLAGKGSVLLPQVEVDFYIRGSKKFFFYGSKNKTWKLDLLQRQWVSTSMWVSKRFLGTFHQLSWKLSLTSMEAVINIRGGKKCAHKSWTCFHGSSCALVSFEIICLQGMFHQFRYCPAPATPQVGLPIRHPPQQPPEAHQLPWSQEPRK